MIQKGKAKYKPKQCVQVTFENTAEIAEMVADTFGTSLNNIVCFNEKSEGIRHIVYNLGDNAHEKGEEFQQVLSDIDVSVLVIPCSYPYCRNCGCEIRGNPYTGIYCSECWTSDFEFIT
jgi:hypothetical protein